jgi:quinol-cytochrome oxidoreductase complex cytochrome b subunit
MKGKKTNTTEKFGLILIGMWSILIFNMLSMYSVFVILSSENGTNFIMPIALIILFFPFVFILYYVAKLLKDQYLTKIEDKKIKFIIEHVIPVISFVLISISGIYNELDNTTIISSVILTYILLFIYNKIYNLISKKINKNNINQQS